MRFCILYLLVIRKDKCFVCVRAAVRRGRCDRVVDVAGGLAADGRPRVAAADVQRVWPRRLRQSAQVRVEWRHQRLRLRRVRQR